MEAGNTSETSANIYQTTYRNIPEASHVHIVSRTEAQDSKLSIYVRLQVLTASMKITAF
jgi:hypothetical protein